MEAKPPTKNKKGITSIQKCELLTPGGGGGVLGIYIGGGVPWHTKKGGGS